MRAAFPSSAPRSASRPSMGVSASAMARRSSAGPNSRRRIRQPPSSSSPSPASLVAARRPCPLPSSPSPSPSSPSPSRSPYARTAALPAAAGSLALFLTPGALALVWAAFLGKGNVGDGLSKALTLVSQGYFQPDVGGENIPAATGELSDLAGDEPLFKALYQWFIDNGGVFKLAFGPKAFIVVSDPVVARHLLKENAFNYDKGVLAEILEPIMGKGLIPADLETWKPRRRVSLFPFFSVSSEEERRRRKRLFFSRPRHLSFSDLDFFSSFLFSSLFPPFFSSLLQRQSQAIVPAFHQAWLGAMTRMFGRVALASAANISRAIDASGPKSEAVVDMEAAFLSFGLDVIGLGVFNFDFGSVTAESPVIKAVYGVLKEAEHRSTFYIPYWNLPLAAVLVPRQRRFRADLAVINACLDDLIEGEKFYC